MNNEFFEALTLLEKEKGVPADYLLEKITAAIAIAIKKNFKVKDNFNINIDPIKNKFEVSLLKEVVEEITDPETQILLDEAKTHKKSALISDIIEIKLQPKEFGRIAAQSAKSVIRQGIREAERGQQFYELERRQHELITGIVQRVDKKNGAVTIDLGKTEAVLLKSEQIEGEVLKELDRVKVYVVDVKEGEKGPHVVISRTHPDLVKRLFELEVPEIYDGTVEIKSISREAGSRTKLAVFSRDENVDAVGACIGNKGVRVSRIVEALNGEKLDIVKYSEDPLQFVCESLSPASVVNVVFEEDNNKSCKVTVPDHQLSLAIGNRGQNVRLAAKLTGFKIDIKPESGFFGEEQ